MVTSSAPRGPADRRAKSSVTAPSETAQLARPGCRVPSHATRRSVWAKPVPSSGFPHGEGPGETAPGGPDPGPHDGSQAHSANHSHNFMEVL